MASSRESIRDYLRELGQAYRDDASNESGEFTRNRIRLELVPKLRELGFPNYDSALIRLADQATELQEWIDTLVDPLMDQLVHGIPNGFQLEVSGLEQAGWPVARSLLVRLWNQMGWPLGELTMAHWSRIREVISEKDKCSDAKFCLPGGVALSRLGNELFVQSPLQSPLQSK
jgi:tRNA(Ile)-lysidine synthase